jgi:hypothetical protein
MLCRRPVGGADERLTTDLEQRPVGELGDGDSAVLAILERPTQRPQASSLESTAQLQPPSWLMT